MTFKTLIILAITGIMAWLLAVVVNAVEKIRRVKP